MMYNNNYRTSIFTQLTIYLKEGKNPSFRYNKNISSLTHFVNYLVFIIESLNLDNENIEIILSLIKNHDYRFVATYLKAYKSNNSNIINIFNKIFINTNKYKINKYKYLLSINQINFVEGQETHNICFTNSLNELKNIHENEIGVYLLEESYKNNIIMLFKNISYKIEDFIGQQYDIPTINAITSQGIVKEWVLPDGQIVISKKNNPLKPERFYKEQNNYEILIKKFNGNSILLTCTEKNKKAVWLKIASPFAVIKEGITKQNYALSIKVEGVLLEDLFMSDLPEADRDMHLYHYRLILDNLYDKGVIWGDMAMRNIIFQEEDNLISYYIFDFEKTSIFDIAIPLSKRIEHCRGQICVEELCTICTISEVTNCMSGYFDPLSWDFISDDNISFPPRDEVLELMTKKKKSYIPLGEYNNKDREIMKIREVKINSLNGEKIFLGHLGFKVEHYLSSVNYKNARKYENLLTHILILMENSLYKSHIINLLYELIDLIEYAFIEAEFESIFLNIKNYSHNKKIIELVNYLIITLDFIYIMLKAEQKIIILK